MRLTTKSRYGTRLIIDLAIYGKKKTGASKRSGPAAENLGQISGTAGPETQESRDGLQSAGPFRRACPGKSPFRHYRGRYRSHTGRKYRHHRLCGNRHKAVRCLQPGGRLPFPMGVGRGQQSDVRLSGQHHCGQPPAAAPLNHSNPAVPPAIPVIFTIPQVDFHGKVRVDKSANRS